MRPAGALGRYFVRFSRPWLAATAALGGAWFLASFPVGYLGPQVHPVFTLLGVLLHFMGLATLLACGVLFAVLWWRRYLDERFFGA